MTADLSQPGERGQDMDFAFGESMIADALKNLFAAAAKFGEVKFPLIIAEFAIAAFFDPVGKILSNLAFQAAEHEGAKFCREPAPGDFLAPLGVLAFRFVILVKIGLRAEIAGVDEIDDAPKVEQPVFEGRSGEGEAVIGAQLFD